MKRSSREFNTIPPRLVTGPRRRRDSQYTCFLFFPCKSIEKTLNSDDNKHLRAMRNLVYAMYPISVIHTI